MGDYRRGRSPSGGRPASRPASRPRNGDSRDRRAPPKGDRSPPPRDRSPPPRDRSPPPRDRSRGGGGGGGRSRSRNGGGGGRSRSRGGGGGGRSGGRTQPPQGRYKITVEGIPSDMSWTELKDLGRQSGGSVTFARTYRTGSRNYGMIEFAEKADADAAIRELDDRRLEGSKDRLRATEGDAAADGALGGYKGHGQYEGGRAKADEGGRRDDYGGRDDRRRSPPRRSRTPPRRSRTPPRRDYSPAPRQERRRSRSRSPRRRSPARRSPPRRGGGKDEEIMTLFVKDLPDDAREDEVREDIEKSAQVLRVMLMRKNDQCSAFTRFGSVKDAERALDDINDGKTRVCGKKVSAQMARRNTEV